MSNTPIEVVRELYALFQAGRLDDTLPLMSHDVLLSEPGDPDILPWAGEFRGHEGVRRFYSGLSEGLDRIHIETESMELLEVEGGRVLALGRERGISAATGRGYETSSAWLWEVRDGQITHLRAFHDTEAMMTACRV